MVRSFVVRRMPNNLEASNNLVGIDKSRERMRSSKEQSAKRTSKVGQSSKDREGRDGGKDRAPSSSQGGNYALNQHELRVGNKYRLVRRIGSGTGSGSRSAASES